MPLYEYHCDDCEHEEEMLFIKPINEIVDPKNCPKCGSEHYSRKMPSSFMFDVVDGFMYNGGRKDYKSRMSMEDQVKVVEGKKDPY